LIQKKQSKKTQKHYNQYFCWILRLTVKLYLAALIFEKTPSEHAPIKEDEDANFVKQYEKISRNSWTSS
jgi:hypothetical protein